MPKLKAILDPVIDRIMHVVEELFECALEIDAKFHVQFIQRMHRNVKLFTRLDSQQTQPAVLIRISTQVRPGLRAMQER